MNSKSTLQNPIPNRNQVLDPLARVLSTPTEGQIKTISDNEELKKKIQTTQKKKKLQYDAQAFTASSIVPSPPSFPPSSSNIPPPSNLIVSSNILSSFLPPPPSSSLPPLSSSSLYPSSHLYPSSSSIPPQSSFPSAEPPSSSVIAAPLSTSSHLVPPPSSSSQLPPPIPPPSSSSSSFTHKSLLNLNHKPFIPTTDMLLLDSKETKEAKEPKENPKPVIPTTQLPLDSKKPNEPKEKKFSKLNTNAASWKQTEENMPNPAPSMPTMLNTIPPQKMEVNISHSLFQNLGIKNLENKAPLGNFPPLHMQNGKPLANIEQNKVEPFLNYEGVMKQESSHVFPLPSKQEGGNSQIGGGTTAGKKKLSLNPNSKIFYGKSSENEKDKQQLEKDKLLQDKEKSLQIEKESQIQIEKEKQIQLIKERLEKEKLEQELLEKERLAKLEQERLEQERLEKERQDKEKQEQERLEQERIEKEREERERIEKELEQEKLREKQRENEKLEKEKKEKLNNKEKYKRIDEMAKNRYSLNAETSQKQENNIKSTKESPLTQSSAESPKVLETVNKVEKEVIKEKIESKQILVDQGNKKEVEKLGKGEDKGMNEEKKPKIFLKSLIELGRKQKSDENVPDYLQNIFRRHFHIYSLKVPKKITLVYDSSKEIERSEIIIKPTVVPIWVNPGDQDDTKKFHKSVVFNLNLLTPDNFEKIRVILLDLIKNNKSGVSYLVEKIIEKAWTEIKYTNTYASLCLWLQKSNDLLETSEDGKTKKKSLFKNVLFENIQKAFENQPELSSQPESLSLDEVKDFLSKKKKKMIGNVQFIGELYLTKVLPFKVIQICSNTMLKYFVTHLKWSVTSKRELSNKESEIDIEALLNLLEKVGRMHEKEKTKEDPKNLKNELNNLTEGLKKLQKTGEVDEKMLNDEELSSFSFEDFFEFLEKMKESPLLENRIKLIIHNLIERRKENWKERLFANEGPKKIEQLHNEYEREQQEIDKRASEFREKEREYDSGYSRRTTTSNISKEPRQSFQVAVDNQKTRKESQELIAAPGNASKMKLNFSVNRENKASQPPAQEYKFTAQDVNERLKDYFSKINLAGSLLPIDSFVPLPKALLLSKFLSSFSEATPPQAELRLKLPGKLFQEKIITKEEFTKEFNKFIKPAAELHCDLPFLAEWMGKMWVGVGAKVDDIRGREEEEEEEVGEFMNVMIKKIEEEMEKEGLINEKERKEIEKLKEKWVERE